MIGYYVHDHGSGHAHRFAALRRVLPGLVGLGSGPRPVGVPEEAWVALPPDADPGTVDEARDPTAGGTLHWAPVGHRGMRDRTATLARWVQENEPSALVVDVSVEVALTARLLSTPTVVVAQHGHRDDPVHRLAHAGADAVVALWRDATHPGPEAAGDRLRRVGMISRFDDRIDEAGAGARGTHGEGPRRAVLLLGAGGNGLPRDEVRATIRHTAPDWTWDVLGVAPGIDAARQVDPETLWSTLTRADVVVSTAGNNCLAEVAAARRPSIVIPQPRPFDEQAAHAAMLGGLGLATVCDAWPGRADWPALLEAAAARDGAAWSAVHDGLGAQRFADVVQEVAAR